ncbi:MAG: RNA-binding protein [Rhodocyclaceae bacterium]|nr:RNA-binding protein [Rhodocyclaceae bacterium]
MHFILSGLQPDTSEALIADGLARYFKVTRVSLYREGDPAAPIAVVQVNDSYVHVWEVANRLRGVFHRGKPLQFFIPPHQRFAQLFDADPADDPREALHLD